MEGRLTAIESKLDGVQEKLDYIIALLKPVNAHSAFVTDLENSCQNNRILRSMVTLRPRTETTLTIG